MLSDCLCVVIFAANPDKRLHVSASAAAWLMLTAVSISQAAVGSACLSARFPLKRTFPFLPVFSSVTVWKVQRESESRHWLYRCLSIFMPKQGSASETAATDRQHWTDARALTLPPRRTSSRSSSTIRRCECLFLATDYVPENFVLSTI